MLIIAVLLLVYIVSTQWLLYCNDAYIEANLIPITPRVSGYVIKAPVQNNQHVLQGDLLIQIDPTPFQLSVEEAQAALGEAIATIEVYQAKVAADQKAVAIDKDQVDLAVITLKRYQVLFTEGAVDAQTVSNQQSATNQFLNTYESAVGTLAQDTQNLNVQKANAANALSALHLAQYNLSLTTITAPADGYLNNVLTYVGTHLTENISTFGLVQDHSWRVIANYKEGVLARLKPGQTVLVQLSSNPWHIYIGKVDSFGHAVARTAVASNPAIPYIEPTTDWIRYPYRFPIQIDLPELPANAPIAMGADVRTLILAF